MSVTNYVHPPTLHHTPNPVQDQLATERFQEPLSRPDFSPPGPQRLWRSNMELLPHITSPAPVERVSWWREQNVTQIVDYRWPCLEPQTSAHMTFNKAGNGKQMRGASHCCFWQSRTREISGSHSDMYLDRCRNWQFRAANCVCHQVYSLCPYDWRIYVRNCLLGCTAVLNNCRPTFQK
jgi:hypothetical protein